MKETKRITRLKSWLKHLHDQVRYKDNSYEETESSLLTMYEIQHRINIFKKLQA
jgi:hypothetical protein